MMVVSQPKEDCAYPSCCRTVGAAAGSSCRAGRAGGSTRAAAGPGSARTPAGLPSSPAHKVMSLTDICQL